MNELVAALMRPPGDRLLLVHDGGGSVSGGGGAPVTVAQLPLGTANDLAAAAGISLVRARGSVSAAATPR